MILLQSKIKFTEKKLLDQKVPRANNLVSNVAFGTSTSDIIEGML